VQLHCDAADTDWAGVLLGAHEAVARGYFHPSLLHHHIHVKELYAVYFSVCSFKTLLQGQCVLVHEDNVVAQWALHKLSSRVPGLMRILRRLFSVLQEHNITLQVTRVRSEDNLADAYTRFHDRNDYCLSWRWFEYLDALWGPHTFDRFATQVNARCAQYNSMFWDPGTQGVDAFLYDWSQGHHNNWANPPFEASVIWRLYHKICSAQLSGSPLRLTVVLPYWCSQPWFGPLAELACKLLVIPKQPGLFAHGSSGSSVYLPAPRWDVCVMRFEL
jgi:hypothetical protein